MKVLFNKNIGDYRIKVVYRSLNEWKKILFIQRWYQSIGWFFSFLIFNDSLIQFPGDVFGNGKVYVSARKGFQMCIFGLQFGALHKQNFGLYEYKSYSTV